MNKDDIVRVRNKDLGVVIIPSKTKQFGLRQYNSLNLVMLENGRLVAVRDDELQLIQQPIEE